MNSSRWISLSGAVNARDLGDLPLIGGGAVRPGRLYRSDNLQDLTAEDVELLVRQLQLRSVVDLRTGAEVRNEGPGPLVGVPEVTVHHLSLFPEVGHRTDAATEVDGPELLPWQDTSSERGKRAAGSTYRYYLADRPDSVIAALRVIAEPDGATLVNCAAGKDRTGVIVALALSEVRVERAAIVEDYVATAERIDKVLVRLASSRTYAADTDPADVDNHRPRAATMQRLLAELDETEGGPTGWLRSHGWTEDDATALRTRLLD
ncbi:MAG: tyrosine-protein phosphatase [Jatrophihabitans sp.]